MDANRVSFICLLWSSLSVLLWPGLSATTSTSTLTSVLYHILMMMMVMMTVAMAGWSTNRPTNNHRTILGFTIHTSSIHPPTNQAKRKQMWEQGVMTGWIKRTSHIHGTVTLLNTVFFVDDCIHAIHPSLLRSILEPCPCISICGLPTDRPTGMEINKLNWGMVCQENFI